MVDDPLSPEARAWVDDLGRRHALSVPGKLLLEEAGAAWDTIRACQRERDGKVMLPSRYKGVDRVHPALRTETEARSTLLRILTALNLNPDLEFGAEMGAEDA